MPNYYSRKKAPLQGLVVPCGDAKAQTLVLSRVLNDESWGREFGKRARCQAKEYFLAGNFLSNGFNPLIRANAWTEVGGFDESLTHAQDWDMWIRLAARYHFVAVPLPQVLYRVPANSASVNTAKIEAASLEVIKRAYNQAPKSLHHLKSLTLTNLYKYLIWRIFESSLGRQRGLVAARYLWHFLRNEPSRFRYVQYKFSLLFKIALLTLTTPKNAAIK